MVIAPCTGNSAAKLANAITDTPVLMAAKAHMRNGKPLVIAISTNDALGASFKNIGMLMNTKHTFPRLCLLHQLIVFTFRSYDRIIFYGFSFMPSPGISIGDCSGKTECK